jgi:hypothetical protein
VGQPDAVWRRCIPVLLAHFAALRSLLEDGGLAPSFPAKPAPMKSEDRIRERKEELEGLADIFGQEGMSPDTELALAEAEMLKWVLNDPK